MSSALLGRGRPQHHRTLQDCPLPQASLRARILPASTSGEPGGASSRPRACCQLSGQGKAMGPAAHARRSPVRSGAEWLAPSRNSGKCCCVSQGFTHATEGL